MPRSLSLAVVGVDYPNRRGPGRRFAIALCKRGDPVELRPEPNNPADPCAVAIFSERGVQMGYLSAERAPWIGGMIRAGREIVALFQEPTRHGCIIRIGIDGGAPELPPEPEFTDAVDNDFWPDYIPPD
jgi:hypothetical protein